MDSGDGSVNITDRSDFLSNLNIMGTDGRYNGLGNVTGLQFHPLLLILIRDTFLVGIFLDPFLRPNAGGGSLIELAQQLIEFWR